MQLLHEKGGGATSRLISVAEAAGQLGVHPKTVRTYFDLVRIGDRTLVRASDIEAKIRGGQRA